MNKEITKVLRKRLEADYGLEFIDVFSGLVQTVTRKDQDANGNPKSIRFPVSYDTNIVDGGKSPEKALTPDSTKKGLIYFEERSPIVTGRRSSSGFMEYRSNIDLVAWINRRKITGDDYSEITKTAIERVIEKINRSQEEENGFVNIRLAVQSIRQDGNIFSKYTYDEEITQFLRPPFEFFAISFVVSFYSRATRCDEPIVLSPNKC